MKWTKINKATIIGSGPNGLAAAACLIKAGFNVTVYEKNDTIGGACRSSELIRRGYIHDTGSSVHPLAIQSLFFRSLPLEEFGLTWITPDFSLAHPLDDGTAAALTTSVNATISTLDSIDRDRYKKLITPLVKQGRDLIDGITCFPEEFLKHPLLMVQFGLNALCSTERLAQRYFTGNHARALIAGLGVHSVMNQQRPGSIAAGLVLATAAHLNGWGIPRGGAQQIVDALSKYLIKAGGKIITGHEVKSLKETITSGLVFLDITPRQFMAIAGSQLPSSYKKRMSSYKYGPGIFKVDWILSKPVPWKADECRTAGTIHVGGSLEEIVASERSVFQGIHAEKPFVMISQPSLFDSTRTPDSNHILWGYCHVPAGSTEDMTERIENQIERFAPGFKETILERHVVNSADIERDNPNCINGDITGGSQRLKRLIFPDVPYHTPINNVFLCSSSTPPGPGVHGMCGYRAVAEAMRKFGIKGN